MINTSTNKKSKSKSVTQKLESEPIKKSTKIRTTLDFSFKEIKKLEDIKNVMPREGEQWTFEGQRKTEQKTKDKDVKDLNKASKVEQLPKEQPLKAQQSFIAGEDVESNPIQTQQPPQKGPPEQKKLPPPASLVPLTNTAGLLITQQNIPLNGKTIGGKMQENKNKNQESKFRVELYCTSLILCQNKLTSLNQFHTIMNSIMPNLERIKWVDLSYNLLVNIDYNFKEMPQLQSLYLNCNQIKDFIELKKLSHLTELRSIKVYGNPIEQIINFRLYIIDLLPQLKRIDSVLVSKKERDNSSMIVQVFDAKPAMKSNH